MPNALLTPKQFEKCLKPLLEALKAAVKTAKGPVYLTVGGLWYKLK